MNTKLYSKPALVPLRRLTATNMKSIRIGENFFDLARLGLIGEYTEVPATDYCPRLYYRWNYKDGVWEIYATEHDLLGYSVVSASEVDEDVADLEQDLRELDERVTVLEQQPDPEPTPEPEDPDVPEPEPTPVYEHSTISRDPQLTGGNNLACIVDGGIMILGGKIEYQCACADPYKSQGNYVGAMITPTKDMWRNYKDQVKVIYNGAEYGKEIFTASGQLILYILITEVGQETPIDLVWSDDYVEHFIVAITQESILLH